MGFLYSIFFGAGVTAFVYSTFARRVGYGNKQNVVYLLTAVFIIATIFFYTIFAVILNI